MFYYTYVLYSLKDNKFYIGHTDNLKKRVNQHKNGLVNATRPRRPLRLVYFEGCLSLYDAIHREKYFKTGYGRGFLKERLKNWKIDNGS